MFNALHTLLKKDAMTAIGFSSTEVTAVLEVTAVVLKLGNIQLGQQFQSTGAESCEIQDDQG